MVATLTPASSITTTMHLATTEPTDWTPERLDRLARGMFPVVFGRPASEGDLVLAEEDSDAAVEERP